MKKLAFILLACISLSAQAKIWRVNNNLGITANFTTLQAAHDGAAAGDTLYLESSPNSYGGGTITKKLTILGAGYFLDKNPDLQVSVQPSIVSTIYLNSGSASSVIEGLSFNGNSLYISSDNVVIRRNHFGQGNSTTQDNYTGLIRIGYYNVCNNVVISQNYACYITNDQPSTGVLITNNLIGFGSDYGESTTNTCLSLHPNTVALVKNNIFRRGQVLTYNCNISNNIMFVGIFTGTGNLLTNNIASGTQFGNTNGNKANIAMTTVFELTGSPDGQWKLKAGSPAIGAGYGSTAQTPIDCGMYGGSRPYVLSGIPAIPSIYYFANKPVGSNSDPIDVQVKVRSNN